MSNPRANPNYEETCDPRRLPFFYDGTIVYDASYYDGGYHSALIANNVAAGKPSPAVQLASSGTAGTGNAANGILLGRLEQVTPDLCSVTVKGCIGFPYSGSNAPTVGAGVICDGSGNVAPVAATGLAVRGTVLSLDTTNHIAYVLL